MRQQARSSEQAADLLDLTRKDVALGRMSPVRNVAEDDLPAGSGAIPRFPVSQGTTADGSPKIRAVDDCTIARVNSATQPQAGDAASALSPHRWYSWQEKMSHDTVDTLFKVTRGLFPQCESQGVAFFKADIDAAFRRVPLLPEHRRWAWVLFRHGEETLAAQHYALPFGAGGIVARAPTPSTPSEAFANTAPVSSVHNWERVGALFTHICQVLLRVPLLRYVDDLFSVDRAEVARLFYRRAGPPPPLPPTPGAARPGMCGTRGTLSPRQRSNR